MRYLVTKDFIDKHTGESHDAGTIMDIDEERASEILSTCEVILPVEEIFKVEAAKAAAEEEAAPTEGDAPKPGNRRRAKKAAGDAQ